MHKLKDKFQMYIFQREKCSNVNISKRIDKHVRFFL